jgi:hypothetical protein
MLKLAHKPPRGPEDLSFSEGGLNLLTDMQQIPDKEARKNTLSVLGLVASVELVDVLEGVVEPRTAEFNEYGLRLITEVSPIISDEVERLTFISSLSIASHAYFAPDEVAVA